MISARTCPQPDASTASGRAQLEHPWAISNPARLLRHNVAPTRYRAGLLAWLLLSTLACSQEDALISVPANTSTATTGGTTGTPDDAGDVGADGDSDGAGSPSTCVRDGDCSDDERCLLDRASVEAACGQPTGEVVDGDQCLFDNDCASNFCQTNRCTNACGDDDDCAETLTCLTLTAGDSSISICADPVVPCINDDNCAAPKICRATDQDPPTFVCQDQPTGSSGPVGSLCLSNDDCLTNLCLEGLCTTPCVNSTECPETLTYLCTAPEPLWPQLCVGPRICQRDGDCGDRERCAFTESAETLFPTCQAETSTGLEPGAPCSFDDNCISNLCLRGRCASPCAAQSDCPEPLLCDIAEVEFSTSLSSRVRACVLAGEPCEGDDQCSDSRCVAERLDDEIVWTCQAPRGTNSPPDSCSIDSDCVHNLCASEQCQARCNEIDDCDITRGLICDALDNNDSFKVCRRPRPCQDTSECDSGEICFAIERGASEIDFGCRQPNEASPTGTPCTGSNDCSANLCLEFWLGDVCSEPCQTADSCQPGDRCTAFPLRGDAAVHLVCAPPEPTHCLSQNDCSGDDRCTVTSNAAGDALIAICRPAAGSEPTGSICSLDDNCASGLCEAGRCVTPCKTRSDCGQEQACLTEYLLERGTLSGQFSLCGMLEERVCTRSADCEDDERVCGLLSTADDEGLKCNFPIEGGVALGEPCDGRFSPNDRCRDRVCLRNITDACSTPCVTDSDCAEGDGMICTDIALASQIRLCAKSCSHDTDCDPAQLCGLNSNITDDMTQFICRTPLGEIATGGSCAGQNDCDHGICVIFNVTEEVTERRCTAPCETDDDCPTELPTCGTATLNSPDSSTPQALRVCTSQP